MPTPTNVIRARAAALALRRANDLLDGRARGEGFAAIELASAEALVSLALSAAELLQDGGYLAELVQAAQKLAQW